MKILLVALTAIALGGCVGGTIDTRPVSRQLPPAAAPEYAVGDEFLFSVAPIEDLHRAIAVDAKTVTFDTRVFGVLTQPKAFSNPITWAGGGIAGSARIWLDGDLSGLFPLEVGKSVSSRGTGNFNGNQIALTYGCSVPRQENIKVKAGEFDTFVVDCLMSHERGGFRTIYWYSPDVGHYVGAERGGRLHELVEYKRAPR